ATIINVNLSGAGGVGGSVIARLLQSSIDRRINPVDIIGLDKLSFALPIKHTPAGLTMKAVGVRHFVDEGSLRIVVEYQFVKA
ncbi:MAG: hypothetical protein LC730_02160, partial [Acidobacteria bacterium]|nr:hypothetical protein [Acidobacteriota bacterium]MCA1608245.1 hypothetical protein [Acidobacteriota bacterium]